MYHPGCLISKVTREANYKSLFVTTTRVNQSKSINYLRFNNTEQDYNTSCKERECVYQSSGFFGDELGSRVLEYCSRVVLQSESQTFHILCITVYLTCTVQLGFTR
jgi:hypothetical protein